MVKKIKIKVTRKVIFEYLQIMVGVSLLAYGTSCINAPNEVIVGGVSGLGIIIRDFCLTRFDVDVPLWLTNTLFNLPLFIVGARVLGMKFIGRTIFATLFFSLALFFTDMLPKLMPDLLLVSVYGAVFTGVGIGLCFRNFSTTGGTDLLANIINKRNRHIPVGTLMFLIDAAIMVVGLLAFGYVKIMYAIIAIFISSKIIDAILEGLNFSKAAFIISDRADAISRRLLDELERGVTGLHGVGMYTKSEKNVLLCVCGNRQLVKLKELAKAEDENAFVIVADVKEVLGEGFSDAQ